MKKETLGKIRDIVIVSFIGFVAIVFMWSIIMIGIKDYKGDSYCGEIYPSEIKQDVFKTSWSNFEYVEEGYIECCRKYFEDHKTKEECEIFKYN